MKLHRDAPADFAAPPRFIELKATLRDDLLRVGVVMVSLFAGGAFVTLTLTLFTEAWQAVGMTKWRGLAIGLWVSIGLAMLPLGTLVVVFLREFNGRHALTMTKLTAEQQSLVAGWLDLDADTHLEDDELRAFLDYVRHLHRGGKTTAADASRLYRIPGPTWQKYRDALITLGYAYQDSKRGGIGFELRPSVLSTSWPKIEADLTKRAGLFVRSQDNPGVLITQPQAPKLPRAKATTLPGAWIDEANLGGD